ncbi:hypothetical protein SRABI26_00334 [Arthrobacter sp. Bi26]|uniref:DUF4238 domain-containing protein n=1 Tax=Arthrobacter sp. Bi26 TaxID=2822350 RepID=UPI001D1DBFB6|nr:DUF4238 domain-containing protein [Arthrobacter sp. Bi26]CAH0135495.1 hypothetical protein SRABI26_00334 [Arthrobacter sp. Bi26]
MISRATHDDWQLREIVPNPWGEIPVTGGGKILGQSAQRYFERLIAIGSAADTAARRHHYVPKTHLRRWSADGRRVWTLNTETGVVKKLGVSDVCVSENFYRVVGSDGEPHNRVELMFGAVDEELRRVQDLLLGLRNDGDISFEDFMAAGVSAALQRMRTMQSRRLLQQYDLWMGDQGADDFSSPRDDADPLRLANIHTKNTFQAMWDAADLMTTRQLEIWDDPKGRFLTSDVPVQIPFVRNVRPGVDNARVIWWPISPNRAVAWSNNLVGRRLSSGRQQPLSRTRCGPSCSKGVIASSSRPNSNCALCQSANRCPGGPRYDSDVPSSIRANTLSLRVASLSMSSVTTGRQTSRSVKTDYIDRSPTWPTTPNRSVTPRSPRNPIR